MSFLVCNDCGVEKPFTADYWVRVKNRNGTYRLQKARCILCQKQFVKKYSGKTKNRNAKRSMEELSKFKDEEFGKTFLYYLGKLGRKNDT